MPRNAFFFFFCTHQLIEITDSPLGSTPRPLHLIYEEQEAWKVDLASGDVACGGEDRAFLSGP